MAGKQDELTQLFVENLTIEDKNIDEQQPSVSSCSLLQREINSSGFKIFDCSLDLGYFSWNPPHGVPYMDLSSIRTPEILTQYLQLDGRPEPLVDLKKIQTPRNFLLMRPHENEHRFPYGNLHIVSLHVAACHRGVDLNKIDFVFGGSTLEMLASRDAASDPFVVTRIPGTNAILVVKSKEYIANFSDFGFQFERLVTGIPMDCLDFADGCTQHLHMMTVGGTYRVLFRAEIDAVMNDEDDDESHPVEIKASNPRYWGTKVMFQMISSGSTKLCFGDKRFNRRKGCGSLKSVSVQPLRWVAKSSLLSSRDVETLEQNIVHGMEQIREQLLKHHPNNDHGVFQILLSEGGDLSLQPVHGRMADILPPPDVVRTMIASP